MKKLRWWLKWGINETPRQCKRPTYDLTVGVTFDWTRAISHLKPTDVPFWR